MAEKMVLVPAQTATTTKLADLAMMLPKTYRNKGTTLLNALDGKIQLDDKCHIVYDDEVGSHVIDLVRYFITPKFLKVSRPFDARKFQNIINQLGLPLSLVVRTVTSEWMKY